MTSLYGCPGDMSCLLMGWVSLTTLLPQGPSKVAHMEGEEEVWVPNTVTVWSAERGQEGSQTQ